MDKAFGDMSMDKPHVCPMLWAWDNDGSTTLLRRQTRPDSQYIGSKEICPMPPNCARAKTKNKSLPAVQLLSENVWSMFNQPLEAQIAHNSRNASSYYGLISEENEIKKICFIVKAKATLSQMYLNHLALNRIFNYKYTKFGSRID